MLAKADKDSDLVSRDWFLLPLLKQLSLGHISTTDNYKFESAKFLTRRVLGGRWVGNKILPIARILNDTSQFIGISPDGFESPITIHLSLNLALN